MKAITGADEEERIERSTEASATIELSVGKRDL
jgi:hypothetical protein